MIRFLVRRLILLLLSAFAAASICFFFLRILPGDAALNLTGMEASDEQIAHARAVLGIDKPLIVQYGVWVSGILHGDFGCSYLTKLPVGAEIVRRLPVTLPLSFFAFIIASAVSVPLGILAAVKRKNAVGIGISAVSAVGVAVPSFWIGIILVWIAALRFRIFPAGGFPREGWADPVAALRSLALPVITVSTVMTAGLIRYVRSVAIDVFSQDYIRTARSLGYTAFRARIRHGLRNMAVPLLTVLGIEFTSSLLGAVVIENVFALPGLGSFLLQGVRSRDFPVVQNVIFLITLFVLVVGFCIDVLQRVIDPLIGRREANDEN
ncbi:MAG TPA: ABC transporter permease [Treponema sp.]|nr:ABC transporter permease [Treponema sp.]